MTNKHLMRLLLLLLAIVIASCAFEEDIIHHHAHENEVKIVQKSLDELLKSQKFVTAAKRIPRKKGFASSDEMSRSALEEQLRFTIIDVPVNVVSIDNKTYYVMKVETDERTDNKLENFVLYEEQVDGKIGDIITYNTEKDAIAAAEQINLAGIKNTRDVTATEIKDPELGKFILVMFMYPYCAYAGTDSECSGYITNIFGCGLQISFGTQWVQDEVGAGLSGNGPGPSGGATSGGSGSGGPGSNGSTGGDDDGDPTNDPPPTGTGNGDGHGAPIISAPVSENSEPPPPTPCDELKKKAKTYTEPNPHAAVSLTDGIVTVPKALQDIQSNIGDFAETAYSVRYIGDADVYGPTAYKFQGPLGRHVQLPPDPEQFAIIHIHLDNIEQTDIPMFAPWDVLALYNMVYTYTGTNNAGHSLFYVTMTAMVEGELRTYAIKIKNLQQLIAFRHDVYDEGKLPRYEIRMLNDYITAGGLNATARALHKVFLERFSQYGVGLYRLKADNNWEELTLAANNYTVTATPCP